MVQEQETEKLEAVIERISLTLARAKSYCALVNVPITLFII
jgi:hypothetical protein